MNKGSYLARSIATVLFLMAIIAFINIEILGIDPLIVTESLITMSIIECLVYVSLTQKMLINWQQKKVSAAQDGKITRRERKELGVIVWSYVLIMLVFAVVSSITGWLIVKFQLGGEKWYWGYEFLLSVIRMTLVILVNYRAFKKLGMKLMVQPGKITTPKAQAASAEFSQKRSTSQKLFGKWERK